MLAESLEIDVGLDLGEFSLRVAERIEGRGVTAIFGPSGSGKSSLLRVLAGLEREARGRVALGDSVWLDSAQRVFLPAHRRPIGYMFQDARLFPHLNVEGNLRFAEKRAMASRASPSISFDDAVAALDLQPLLSRRTAGLSGGERQRVALGRTLLAQPRLLLLDEPLAALDSARKHEILPYVESLHSTFGVPVIYVSHATDEVALLADRLLVLSEGRITASGPTAETLRQLDLRPLAGRDRAAAVLEAEVQHHDARFDLTWLELDGQQLSVPRIRGLEVGERARLLVQARDVSLAVLRPEAVSIRNVLTGTVSAIEEDRASAFAEVTVDLGTSLVRARITRASLHELGLTEGSPVFALLKSVSVQSHGLHRSA